MAAPAPKWISVSEAADIEGSCLKTFQEWVRRWNLDLETRNKVKRRHGKVEYHSLIAALDEDASKFDQGKQVTSAYQALTNGHGNARGARIGARH